jgi:hypothetical protein
MSTDVSEERNASIFRVEKSANEVSKETSPYLATLTIYQATRHQGTF